MKMRGIFLNFLAQLVYHDAEILRLPCVVGSQDNLQQSPMGCQWWQPSEKGTKMLEWQRS
jgi:hypothetical protein